MGAGDDTLVAYLHAESVKVAFQVSLTLPPLFLDPSLGGVL